MEKIIARFIKEAMCHETSKFIAWAEKQGDPHLLEQVKKFADEELEALEKKLKRLMEANNGSDRQP